MLNFNKLKFEKRKRIHFFLIGFIVFLQFLISVTWINENYNESILVFVYGVSNDKLIFEI